MPAPDPRDNDQVDFSGLFAWARRQNPVRCILAGMVAIWVVTFITLGWIRHSRFTTYGYDLGIYDQSAWLLAHLRSLDTVRGLPVFGNHVTLVLLPLIPFYWFGAGPIFLLIVQVAAQASGAVAAYLLARERLGDRVLALLPAAALLLNPTYQYLTWEFFHPDAIAAAALLFAFWLAYTRRWGWFAVAVVVAIACKEDVALAIAGLGVLICLRDRQDRKHGLITVGASLVWYLVATRLIIPVALNGQPPFYEAYFPDFGHTAFDVVRNILTHPTKVWNLATRPDRLSYYRRMLVPFGLLALVGWRPLLLLAGPTLAVNVLTSASFTRDYRYHYSAIVVAACAVAAVEGIAHLGRTATLRRFLAGSLAAVALATSVAWGPSPIGAAFKSGIWPLDAGPRPGIKASAVASVPANASVAATYTFVPHLTHRRRIYQFPEPFLLFNWGIGGRGMPDPKVVQWLVVDRRDLFSEQDKDELDRLLRREFTVTFDRDDVVVAHRRPAG